MLVWFRFLGGVRDEQRRSWVGPVHLHDWPCCWPATPPSGWGRGGDGRGPGARSFIVLNPQWRHGEDPAGRSARVEPQQLVLRQVGVGYCLQSKTTCGRTSLFFGGAGQHLSSHPESEQSDACWAPLRAEVRHLFESLFFDIVAIVSETQEASANVTWGSDLCITEQKPGIKPHCGIKLSLLFSQLAYQRLNTWEYILPPSII